MLPCLYFLTTFIVTLFTQIIKIPMANYYTIGYMMSMPLILLITDKVPMDNRKQYISSSLVVSGITLILAGKYPELEEYWSPVILFNILFIMGILRALTVKASEKYNIVNIQFSVLLSGIAGNILGLLFFVIIEKLTSDKTVLIFSGSLSIILSFITCFLKWSYVNEGILTNANRKRPRYVDLFFPSVFLLF